MLITYNAEANTARPEGCLPDQLVHILHGIVVTKSKGKTEQTGRVESTKVYTPSEYNVYQLVDVKPYVTRSRKDGEWVEVYHPNCYHLEVNWLTSFPVVHKKDSGTVVDIRDKLKEIDEIVATK